MYTSQVHVKAALAPSTITLAPVYLAQWHLASPAPKGSLTVCGLALLVFVQPADEAIHLACSSTCPSLTKLCQVGHDVVVAFFILDPLKHWKLPIVIHSHQLSPW